MGYEIIEYYDLLKRGNELCKRREVSPKLIKQVQETYRKCQWIMPREGPLVHASRRGYDHMVWGFIQLAKQTGKDLQTGRTLDIQKFLSYKDSDGDTALHMAARGDKFEVVKLLLEYLSVEMLIFDRNKSGETPVSLLKDPKYDECIFKVMEAAHKEKGDRVLHPPTSISISIDKKHQEAIVYEECIMDVNSYLKSHKNETRLSLDNLNKGVCELTYPNRNTILHLVCKFGDINYAKDLLKEHSSLIHYQNSDGETPFYVAAREGHIDILMVLINYVRPDELVKMATRLDKHTALHIAVQNHHPAVVFWLVKEIPQLANHINDFNVSALYLAAERNYFHILRLILNECKEKAFDGPDGKTALHAAVINARECTPNLLRENKGLLYIHDKYGWTPLHYAAHYDKSDTIRVLLDNDPNIGFQMTTGNELKYSAIQIAASRGHRDSMEVIMSKCPQCSEITDINGRNILHIAVENNKRGVIQLIFTDTSLISLINQRDNNGNTPIHLYMASDVEVETMVIDHKVNIYVRNNENLTPLEMASTDEKRDKLIKAMATRITGFEDYPPPPRAPDDDGETTRQMLTRLGDNVALVVTLIATATFAAAFTVPGGFDGNEGSDEQGMPILLGKAAYKAFVFANALAFSCSCCVLAAHIRLQFYLIDVKEYDNKSQIDSYYIITLQYLLTAIAMIAMGVAFVTGSYVILAPSLGFAITICATCLCIMVSLSFLPRKYLRAVMRLRDMKSVRLQIMIYSWIHNKVNERTTNIVPAGC